MYARCHELDEVQQRIIGPVQVIKQDAQRLAMCQGFDKVAHRHMQGTLVGNRGLIHLHIKSTQQCQVTCDL